MKQTNLICVKSLPSKNKCFFIYCFMAFAFIPKRICQTQEVSHFSAPSEYVTSFFNAVENSDNIVDVLYIFAGNIGHISYRMYIPKNLSNIYFVDISNNENARVAFPLKSFTLSGIIKYSKNFLCICPPISSGESEMLIIKNEDAIFRIHSLDGEISKVIEENKEEWKNIDMIWNFSKNAFRKVFGALII